MTKPKKNKSPEEAKEKGFKFRYILTFAFFALIFLSLFSHNSNDFAIMSGGHTGEYENWAGEAGALTARLLLYFFGIASYPITVFILICGIRPFLPYHKKKKGYLSAVFAAVFGTTLLFGMHPESFIVQTDQLGIGHSLEPLKALSGGVIGQQLAAPMVDSIPAGFLRHYIGNIGSTAVATIFTLSGLFFVLFSDWKEIILVLYKKYQEKKEDLQNAPAKEKAPKEKKQKEEDHLEELFEIEDLPQQTELNIPEIPILNEEEEYIDDEPEEEVATPALGQMDFTPPPLERVQSQPSYANNYRQEEYTVPPLSLISKVKAVKTEDANLLSEASFILQSTLESFKVKGKVTGVVSGPRVSRYEVSLEPGVKVEKVTSISNNIAMELSAESIRILAPIPGKNAVGVEIPNSKASPVFFRNMVESESWRSTKADLPIVLGKDVSGKAVILDLAKAPHLLIAGATGSGKSVCMNTLIMSMIMRFSPDELRLIMVDPKVVELEMYRSLPHLITPVVNDSQKVPLALRWGVNEMEKRYRILAKVRAKNLKGFNERPKDNEPVIDSDGKVIPQTLPYLVIIVDELADVMMTDAKADVETSIAKIAQKGRAAGIHIVIATQRPSTNIITGVIKANLPTRIAFRVGSLVDSRVILDAKGAEKLLGQGDMLFVPPGASNIERIQGAFVDDNDIQKVVDFSAEQRPQDFDTKVVSSEEEAENEKRSAAAVAGDPVANSVLKYIKPDDNDLIKQSLEIIFRERKASTSYLQRRLKIGYNRAAEIIDVLEERGIVSAPLPGGSKREILVTDGLEENKN